MALDVLCCVYSARAPEVLKALARPFEGISGFSIATNGASVGANSFAQEAGLVVRGFARDPFTPQAIVSELVEGIVSLASPEATSISGEELVIWWRLWICCSRPRLGDVMAHVERLPLTPGAQTQQSWRFVAARAYTGRKCAAKFDGISTSTRMMLRPCPIPGPLVSREAPSSTSPLRNRARPRNARL